jgi:antitoxin component of MazEF toxin-antitoxin module
MFTTTKKLWQLGGSKAVIIPNDWLSKFGDVAEVLLQIDDCSIIIKPLPTSLTANLRTKTEAIS